MDDFLWECALQNKNCRELNDLVPGYQEEIHQWDDLTIHKYKQNTFPIKFIIDSDLKSNLKPNLTIKVQEVVGNGVFDVIGGSLWEASYLLCAYIIRNIHLFQNQNILELGSGISFPSLMLIEIYRKFDNFSFQSIHMSDNDPIVLNNLMNILSSLRSTSLTNTNNGKKVSASIHKIDWISFDETSSLYQPYDKLCDIDIIIGSALVYSPYHSCLADTLYFFLCRGCKEVIIIQIRDRPGFDKFLVKLETLGIQYSIEEISDDIYHAANNFISNYTSSNTNSQSCLESMMNSNFKSYSVDYQSIQQLDNASMKNTSEPKVIKTDRQSFNILRITRSKFS